MFTQRSHTSTPPPPIVLPRNPSRSLSTTSTSFFPPTSPSSGLLPPSPGGLGPLASPASISISMRTRTPSNTSINTGHGTAPPSSPMGDELDKLGYMYSLRVAVLHHYMLSPSPPPTTLMNRMSTQSSFSTISTPPIPPLPSPPLHGTSPNGSRFTFQSFGHSPSGQPPKTPELPQTPNSATSPVITRRKSQGFGLSLGKSKSNDPDSTKLPKEFLLEFWGTLAGEDGDEGWKTTVSQFLSHIKKGTKTESGLNLRDVPVLLDAFTASIPPPAAGSTPAHAHQSHFLQLLYNSLPRSSHFSPLARPQSEKDRDQLFRIRGEVQSYMLVASPNPDGDYASSNLASPTSTTPRRSPIGLGRASMSASSDNVKRKPSPVWDGDSNEMIDTVGLVWNVRKDVYERDVADIKRNGALEQLYMTDIKRAMTALSTIPQPHTSSQKARQASLSQTLSNLLNDFPQLSIPSSPTGYSHIPLSPSSENGPTLSTMIFTPPRNVEVFSRLASRAAEAGHSTKTRDLVERCREVWGVASRREKEKEMDGLIARWGESIGTKDEVSNARAVADGIRLLSFGMRDGDPLPPVLDVLLNNLLSLATTSLPTIFPTTSSAPPAPPPSLLVIFNAAPQLFASQPNAQKALQNAADELKGAAIGEYVSAVEYLTGGVGQTDDGFRQTTDSGKDSMVEGFEKVALWIEKEIANIRKVWGRGLGSSLNPAAIIISRQLPLFLAELQILDKPRGAGSDIFVLYDTTSKLLDLWDDLCPNQETGFELDAFFEPHVLSWLKDTEANNVHEWVSRSVGMDSWVPEGENKHSQSVIDLFEFIRESAQTILHGLPLGEYKRAIYLIDYSKTVSVAVSQYASTVHALFLSDLSPAKVSTPTIEVQNKLGSKASSWLAKGQQAVKNLERKKVDGFSIPPAACVKLTDMGAASVSLEDLVYAMEAEETSRIIKQHKFGGGSHNEKSARHIFTVSVMRGETLLGKGLSKPADGFVVVVDKENGERLLKTRTVLGAEDPRWEQSFEVSVGTVKLLELQAYDRQLVGKHDLIGSSTFRLDPRAFTEYPIRDVVLPLSPRGVIHLRISMEGGEKHDVAYHLSTAGRALDRAASDMSRELVDKMSEFIKSQLSVTTLQNLTKPLKDKKKAKTMLSEGDIEGSLAPLFDYLNENFSVFSVTLTLETRLRLMLQLWHRIIDILISLLVPPLSDKPSPNTKESLGSSEIDVVFKWLQLLKGFFNASEGGVEHGVPLMKLQQGPYKDILMLGQYLDLPTPTLKERCSAAVKAASSANKANNGVGGISSSMRGMRLDDSTAASAAGVAGVASVGGKEDDNERMAQVMLRIARTRPDTAEFLTHEIGLLRKARADKQQGVL